MSLENIVSRNLKNTSWRVGLNEIITHAKMWNFDEVQGYDVDIDGMEDITVDSECLFSEYLKTTSSIQHCLNIRQNEYYFKKLDEELIFRKYCTNDKEQETLPLIYYVGKAIVLRQILARREILDKKMLTCTYCDHILTNDAVKCSICNSVIVECNDFKSLSNDNETHSISNSFPSFDTNNDLDYCNDSYLNSSVDMSRSKCQYCHSSLQHGVSLCSICNGETVQQTTVQIVMNVSREDWTCNFCRSENSSTVLQCNLCEMLAPIVMSWTCAMCYSDNQRTKLECAQCSEMYGANCTVTLHDSTTKCGVDGSVRMKQQGKVLGKQCVPCVKEVLETDKLKKIVNRYGECKECIRTEGGLRSDYETNGVCWNICNQCRKISIFVRLEEDTEEEGLEEHVKHCITSLRSDIDKKRCFDNGFRSTSLGLVEEDLHSTGFDNTGSDSGTNYDFKCDYKSKELKRTEMRCVHEENGFGIFGRGDEEVKLDESVCISRNSGTKLDDESNTRRDSPRSICGVNLGGEIRICANGASEKDINNVVE